MCICQQIEVTKLAVLFITTILCYSDLDWNDEKYFPHEKEDEDDEEDDDDDDYKEDEEDENDEEDDNNPLIDPLKKSSDPFVRFRRVFRRGGLRFRRFFGRRRSGR